MKYLHLVCCLIAVINFAESADSVFKFENCHSGKSIADVTRFKVSPDPISLNKNITATVDINLHQDIPPNTFVQNKIYKITSLFGLSLKAPCIGGSGSCTTEICKYLGEMKNQTCPFFQKGVECGCPLKAGYFGGQNVTITLPKLGPLIKFLASGKFKMEMKIFTKEKSKEKVLFCHVFSGTVNQ